MRAGVPLCLIAALAAAGCARPTGGATTSALPTDAPGEAEMRSIPLGQPPGQSGSIALQIQNPYEGDAAAVAEGKALFQSMNCAYCHGAAGDGLIGPPLNSRGWRYGGAPAQLYNSIHDGRPQGMPAWGARLPPDQIWKLVAFIESLGGATPPATMRMRQIAGAQPSTTGEQPNGQSQTDSAHQALVAGDNRSGTD